jgi:multimeric flavodoxin WrbA
MAGKVLMLNGSNRKKNTYNVLVQIGQVLKEHAVETEILNLFDYEIKDCAGCDEFCVERTGCHVKDGLPEIMQKILDSDGVVFSSPVYRDGVTSKFKAFADRTNAWSHRPETVGKPMICVTTTTVTGIKETEKFFDSFITGLGARKGAFISRTAKNIDKPVQQKELSEFISLLQKDKKDYRPGMDEIIMFEVQKVLALKSSGETKKFWEEKKWLNRWYYYDCKMGLLKKGFSRMMFKILSNVMK